ncbi:hypothetical protein TSAR_013031, partial [Trichomalopsis sarcophagae]
IYDSLQIDVLEDDAFKYLSTLRQLDLAYNGIVAVSSASLAHLENLRSLDLTHNFLRSLNADLVVPLRKLEELRLDDNDITMVSSDLATSKLKLKSFSLADNPLNCDCSLLDFASWLASSNSSLPEEDRSSAVCATPPALENAVLSQVSPESLLCGDPTPPIMTRLPLASAQLTLNEFHYEEGTGADLLWRVEPCTERYTCDTLLVYEALEADNREVQIASSPIECDSRQMHDPCSLPISLPSSLMLEPGHKYRYCVVLMVQPATSPHARSAVTRSDEVSLGLGCSDIIELDRETLHLIPELEQPLPPRVFEISTIHVNASADGYLKVEVIMSTGLPRIDCEIDLDVFALDSGQVQRQKVNCSSSSPVVTMAGLIPGRYRVCASLAQDEQREKLAKNLQATCVEVQTFKQQTQQNSEMIISLLALLICALTVVVFLVGRSLLRKTKLQSMSSPPCFIPAQQVEITHKAHYIKLLATTKL